jgi:hypothetical protein
MEKQFGKPLIIDLDYSLAQSNRSEALKFTVKNPTDKIIKTRKLMGKRLCSDKNHQSHAGIAGGKVAGKLTRKLTFEQAEEIRFKFNNTKTSTRKLAKEYDTTHTTVGKIIKNKLYTSK